VAPHGRVVESAASPRPLTAREREILDFLLSAEVPGVRELREQAATALAVPWDCGCASIDLTVDRTGTRASRVAGRPAIEAASKERGVPEQTFDLLLWVDDGWLSGVEIVDYGESHGAHSATFPPPEHFGSPEAR
jgi:hypothetical protein